MGRRFVEKSLIGIGLLGLFFGLSALVGAPILVRVLLGAGYESAVPVIRLLSPLPPLVAINTVFGLYWAVPFGHERAFLRAIFAAAITNIVLAVILVPQWGVTGMCVA